MADDFSFDGGDTTLFDTSALDSSFADNSSGTVAYNPNTTVTDTTGAVINTAQNPLPAADASGGNGSFLSPLQNVLTQGLNDTLISATEFGLGAFNDRLAVAATGGAQPAAAQSPGIRKTANTTSWLIIGALVVFVVVLAARE
jgi:hypothetical protein